MGCTELVLLLVVSEAQFSVLSVLLVSLAHVQAGAGPSVVVGVLGTGTCMDAFILGSMNNN
jgi:hypothetical protein